MQLQRLRGGIDAEPVVQLLATLLEGLQRAHRIPQRDLAMHNNRIERLATAIEAQRPPPNRYRLAAQT
ncbi:MAG: hypothetical protein NVS2B12_40740 [Ktedonobacteraceae bacterium]